jgi:hypothetical protein
MPIPRSSERHAFIRGVARLVDFTGGLSRRRMTVGPWEALIADGAAVRHDLWRAVERAADTTGVDPDEAMSRADARHASDLAHRE